MGKNTTSHKPNELPQFFNMKSSEFKNLYFLYLDLCVAKISNSEIIQSLSQSLIASFSFPEVVSLRVAKILYEYFSNPSFSTSFCDLYDASAVTTIKNDHVQIEFDIPATPEKDGEHPQKLFMSQQDYARYNELTSCDPHISPVIKHFLLALIAVYRRNFHASGWVRYDRKTIIHLAGLESMNSKDIEEVTQYLHQEYGFEMQVVGSNSPIPCFKIDWLFNQTQPGSHLNPFLDFGLFIPETIENIALNKIEPVVVK